MIHNAANSAILKTQTNNPKILVDHIISLSETRNKQDIINELNKVDEQYISAQLDSIKLQIITIHPHVFKQQTFSSFSDPNNSYLASTFHNTASVSLGVPKNNSLTDSFLRSTLGCQQKLAKSYMQILDQTDLTQQLQREKRIEQAKKRFAEANNYKDFYANCKPFLDKTVSKSYLKRTQPVVDNQHESYLKTQLIYLEKPLVGKKLSEKEYYDKHADIVAKKINQIGGMQDTLANMQQSLNKNQIKNFTKRSHFGNTLNPFKRDSKNIGKKAIVREAGNSWVDRSRSIREAIMTKFDIE